MTTQQHSKHPDWDELWEKLQNRDWDWLRGYIKSHDINQCTDEQGNTLLHCAARDKNPHFIAFLSDFFLNPNIKNAAGQTALQLVQDTDPDCLKTLHHWYLCIDFAKASTKPNELNALFAAIYRGDATLGDTSGVKKDGNERNAGGWTALHCAVMYDRPHLIRELHQRFPKLAVGLKNIHKQSALRLAAMRSHSNCIIALCECFPEIKSGDILHVACECNQAACIPTLRQCFPHITGNELTGDYFFPSPLLVAVENNSVDCIRALHSCFPDIDPNFQTYPGDTALTVAVRLNKSRDCIPVLAECFPNLDPNKQDKDGQGFYSTIALLAQCSDVNRRPFHGDYSYTALMKAIYTNDEKCVLALCQSFPNLDPNVQDRNGETALMHAIMQYPHIVPHLHRFFPNIDPNIQAKDGSTALMIAVSRDNPDDIISQLHEWFPNIDPNIQNKDGDTALIRASMEGTGDDSILPLRKSFPNIDPNIQNKDQNSALMCMLKPRYSFVDSIRQLLDAFPNLNVHLQNSQGETALTIAIDLCNDKKYTDDGELKRCLRDNLALLLERFPDIVLPHHNTNTTGKPVLVRAMEKNDFNLISMLLQHLSQID